MPRMSTWFSSLGAPASHLRLRHTREPIRFPCHGPLWLAPAFASRAEGCPQVFPAGRLCPPPPPSLDLLTCIHRPTARDSDLQIIHMWKWEKSKMYYYEDIMSSDVQNFIFNCGLSYLSPAAFYDWTGCIQPSTVGLVYPLERLLFSPCNRLAQPLLWL